MVKRPVETSGKQGRRRTLRDQRGMMRPVSIPARSVPASERPARRVDAVVFDLGNVIIRWDPYGPFEGLASRAEIEAVFAEIDFFGVNHAQDAGRSWAEGRAEVAARFPGREWVLDRYLSHFEQAIPGPVPGTEAILEGLRAEGFRLLGLTNFSAETYPRALPVAPAIGLLEDVVVSGEVGQAKPDPAIFALLLERYGLEPGAPSSWTTASAMSRRLAPADSTRSCSQTLPPWCATCAALGSPSTGRGTSGARSQLPTRAAAGPAPRLPNHAPVVRRHARGGAAHPDRAAREPS